MFNQLIFICFAILISAGLYSQSSDYIYSHYTITDGLPSNEVHDILQDSDGYIWIATDNGVARFDGRNFKRYGYDEGLGDIVIFELEEGIDGHIWAGGINNEIYIYDGLIDRFEPYPHNSIIKDMGKRINTFAKDFIISNENELIINRHNLGLLTINTFGDYSLDTISPEVDFKLFHRGNTTFLTHLYSSFYNKRRDYTLDINGLTNVDSESQYIHLKEYPPSIFRFGAIPHIRPPKNQ